MQPAWSMSGGLSRNATHLASDEVILDQFSQMGCCCCRSQVAPWRTPDGAELAVGTQMGQAGVAKPSSVLSLCRCVGQPEPRAQINFLL